MLVARQRVEVAHDARALVRGEQPRDVVGELVVVGRLGGRRRHDPGDDALAQVGVGLAGDRGLDHGGVLEQRRSRSRRRRSCSRRS